MFQIAHSSKREETKRETILLYNLTQIKNKEYQMTADKRYKIKLTRLVEVANAYNPKKPEPATIGRLEVIDTESKDKVLATFYTCENGGPSTDTAMQDKRIVSRDYDLEWTDSSKNGALARKYPEYKMGDRNKAIWVTCDEALPYFRKRRILVHSGNYANDTEGCILVGKAKNTTKGFVSNSVQAIYELFKLIEKLGIENCYLRVMDI